VILPDANLLLYAYSGQVPQHQRARSWWAEQLSGDEPVGIPWLVVLAFVRLTTQARVLAMPMRSGQALDIVETWFRQPPVQVLEPGPRHLELVRSLLADAGVAGNLTTDAHLAGLAIEHNCTLHSNDADFGRFSGLRWVNPLA
jgi:uncharacterized protein